MRVAPEFDFIRTQVEMPETLLRQVEIGVNRAEKNT
jgi:hypothetical protein